MPRKSKYEERLVNYQPGRGKYEKRSHAYILAKVKGIGAVADQVVKLAEEVTGQHQAATNTIDHMVSLFLGKHDLGIPADKRYVMFDAKSAKPADVIFRVMGMLNTPPRYQYVAPYGQQKDDADADDLEAHLNAFPTWHHKKYQTRYDVQNRFWQLLAGRSYIRQSFLPAYWDKTEMRRKPDEEIEEKEPAETKAKKNASYNARVDGYRGYMGPPVFREQLDPRMVFPIHTAQGPQAHILRYKVQRFEADEAFYRVGKKLTWSKDGDLEDIQDLRKAPGLELPEQSDAAMNTSVTYYEYLDDNYCYYVVGNHVVHEYEHKGGIKIFPAYCLMTGFKEYEHMAMGLLWPVRNEIPQFDFMRTLWVQKAYLDVFPQLFAQLGEKDDPITKDDQPVEWAIEPMTVKQIRGQLVNALKDAQSGMDFRAAVEMFAGDIDLATIPPVGRGLAGAQQPGYSINQLGQTMRTQWTTAIDSAELQEAGLAEHYLFIIRELAGADVTIFAPVKDDETGRVRGSYLTLAPEKIHPFCQVIAKLDPELPIDLQGNMITWANLHEKGMVTWEDYVREGLRKVNPVAMRKKIMTDLGLRAFLPKALEDAMALGRVRLTNEMIEESGLKDTNKVWLLDVQALKEARAGQSATAPPGGATPPGVAPGAMPQQPAPPGELGPEGSPVPATAGAVAQVSGANPANPTPGYRG